MLSSVLLYHLNKINILICAYGNTIHTHTHYGMHGICGILCMLHACMRTIEDMSMTLCHIIIEVTRLISLIGIGSGLYCSENSEWWGPGLVLVMEIIYELIIRQFVSVRPNIYNSVNDNFVRNNLYRITSTAILIALILMLKKHCSVPVLFFIFLFSSYH